MQIRPHIEMIHGSDHSHLQSQVNHFLSHDFISKEEKLSKRGQKKLIDIKYSPYKDLLSAMIIYEQL